jgi:tetratricopeptide (TPR) repeat protein
VHQDVKPDNIIVLRGGRTVLADYGFVAAQGENDLSETAGTPAFMAPEQMDGKLLPSCDWYALGISLREITASTPGEQWPEGYEELQRSLTHPSYAQRGGFEDVLRWTTSFDLLHSAPEEDRKSIFVGREAELSVLAGSFNEMLYTKELRLVQVSGESGIGKSTLIEEFLSSRSEAAGKRVLIFKEGCHLRENVHLRILDSLVDELSIHLLSLGQQEIEHLKPRNLGALVHLFPVLGRVQGFRSETLSYGEDSSFVASGTRALKELMAKLCEQQPVIFFIDNFQWADSESLQAISTLLSPPNNPAMLVIVALREEALSTELADGEAPGSTAREFLEELEAEHGISVERVAVRALDPEGSKRLLNFNGVNAATDDAEISAFISTCEGNPLLLTRMIQHFLDRRISQSIDECLKEEMVDLTENERDLVKLIAISGHPIRISALSRMYPGAQDSIETLAKRAWLKQRLLANREYVEIFHDRVRHAITLSISKEESQSLHYRLATMLRGDHGFSASHLVGHYLSAGHQDEAAALALEAAEASAKSFALNQAASLFETAFQLRGSQRGDRWILERQAESLMAANRYVDAGEVYSRLITLLEDDLDQPLLLSRIYSTAADAYLRGGDAAHARSLFAHAIKLLGIDPDKASTRRLVKLYRLATRFLTPSLKARKAVNGETRIRLEILDTLVRTALAIDLKFVNILSVVRLRESLKAGDPDFAALAAITEGSLRCFLGGSLLKSGVRLIRAGQSWHDGSDPLLNAMNERSECTANLFLGNWREGADAAERGEAILLTHLPNDQFELGMMRQYHFINLANLGELADLSKRLKPLIVDATERRDIGRLIFYTNSQCALAHLSEDRSRDVLSSAEEYSALLPSDQFSTQHYFVFQAEILARLYEGQFESALERINYRWDAIVNRNMLKTNYWGIELRSYRGIVFLSLAALGIEPEHLRNEVREQVTALRKLPGGTGAASMLEGHLLLLEGKLESAVKCLQEAEALWKQAGMRLHYAFVRRRLAEIGAAQPSDQADNEALFSEISNPSSMMNCYVPAIRQ